MRDIRFRCQDTAQAQFGTILRKNVDNYFKETGISPKGNWEIRLKSAMMFALYLLPFVALLVIPMPGWLALVLAVVMGVGNAGVGMGVMHDAVHGAYSRRRWVNELMGGSMYLLGSNVLNWKLQHNLKHHTYTNIEGLDNDISSHGPIRLSENAPIYRIHRYQHWYAFLFYGLVTLSKMVKDFSQFFAYNKEGIIRERRLNPSFEFAKLVASKVAYIAIIIGLPLLLTDYNLWQILAGFFLMHWVASCILSTIFQLAHVVEGAQQPVEKSPGLIDNDWMVHELQTTANFARKNRLLNWYIGGLNFQIEHHLFPHISHVHYRHIAPIVEQTAHEFGYDYNVKNTFCNALASHVRRLKELGTYPAEKE